ncbi:MAG: HlyC/CorC family transporter [Chloroflexota bacterium]|nr:HlyC/CorC family transporter [Chloroflexota bacterium]MDE3194504.1 HlyC/CorC family transporter [Chloroflexota bacterium]
MSNDLAQLLAGELALVILLAIFSAGETAVRGARRPHILEEIAGRGRRGRVAERIRERSIEYISALEVMEFLDVFAYSAIAAAFVAPRLQQILLLVGVTATVGGVGAVVVSVVVLTVIALLFGLFLPRSIGARYPGGVLLTLIGPIEAVRWVTKPIVGGLWWTTQVLTRPFGVPAQTQGVSEDEIRALVETGEEQGVLHEQERDMIQGIFELGDKHVHDVMIPRPDVRAIDIDTPGARVLEQVVAVGHSRIPVYEGTPDEIIGILYVKDMFRRLARGEKDVSLRQYLRPAHFVPETKRVDELLGEMQRDKLHMAIVVDEYGGTAGLVTIEDLVEEIVGEIRDEYEAEQELVIPVSENEALMDGRVPFDDVREAFELDLPPSEDYDTLGGYIVHELGRLPRPGEDVRVGSVRFTVESVEARRIRRVRVRREEAPQPDEEAVER